MHFTVSYRPRGVISTLLCVNKAHGMVKKHFVSNNKHKIHKNHFIFHEFSCPILGLGWKNLGSKTANNRGSRIIEARIIEAVLYISTYYKSRASILAWMTWLTWVIPASIAGHPFWLEWLIAVRTGTADRSRRPGTLAAESLFEFVRFSSYHLCSSIDTIAGLPTSAWQQPNYTRVLAAH